MKLLLHGCCADCTLKFIAGLKDGDIEEKLERLTVFYYNPNIHPRSEYQARLGAIQKICREQATELVIADWRPKEYFEVVDKKEGRCPKCWNLRLSRAAQYAKDQGYSHFSSTLITSQYQNRDQVATIGQKWAKECEIEFFQPKTICCELKTAGFYKQFFCGCVYSLTERFEEKYRS